MNIRYDEELEKFCMAKTEKQMYFSLNEEEPLSRFKQFEKAVNNLKACHEKMVPDKPKQEIKSGGLERLEAFDF